MTRRTVGRVVALFAAIVTSGCTGAGPAHEGDPDLDARVRVSPTPAAVGPARVSVQASYRHDPLAGARVRLRTGPASATGGAEWASETWTGAEWTAVEPTTVVGTYGPIEVDFPFVGDWVVEVEIALDEGRSARVRHPIAVVSAR